MSIHNFDEGKGKINAEKKNNQSGAEQPLVEETEQVDDTQPDEGYTQPTANVGFGMTYTRNLGNYESLKVSVQLNLPCYVTEIDDIAQFAKEWVDQKLTETNEEIARSMEGDEGGSQDD